MDSIPGDLAIPGSRRGSRSRPFTLGSDCQIRAIRPFTLVMPGDLAILREREGQPCRGIWQSPGSARGSHAGGFGKPRAPKSIIIRIYDHILKRVGSD
ncbi:hypothetical protein QUF72_17095 [Desulfobacterales bacterium HSG2]|nr:hypothetical protein [Desulfobacterales bacterium HSG2]